MPKPRPAMQKRIPISSSLWPSMALLKKLTDERSGSFSPASPPASCEGWAKLAVAPSVTTASRAAIDCMKRHPCDAIWASQMRMGILHGPRKYDFYGFRHLLPQTVDGHKPSTHCRSPNTLPPQDWYGMLSLAASDVQCAVLLPAPNLVPKTARFGRASLPWDRAQDRSL